MPDLPRLAGTKVLVTGAAGFLGTHLCRHLAQQGCLLFGIDRQSSGQDGSFLRFIVGDLAQMAQQCLQAFEPEVVFHLAGGSSVPDSVRNPTWDFDATVPGTVSLLAAAVASNRPPPRIVYFSSAAVYGEVDALPVTESAAIRPISPYGAHKATCEALLEHYARIGGFDVSILRIFSAYGEGLRRQFFWDFAARALDARSNGDKRVLVLGTNDESRDFIHAQDVARVAALIAQHPAEGVSIYNVAAGAETPIAWAAEKLLGLLGLDLELHFEGVAAPGYPRRWQADTSRLNALGFRQAASLEARLPDLARWIAAEHARRVPQD